MFLLRRCIHKSREPSIKWTEKTVFTPDKLRSLGIPSSKTSVLDPRKGKLEKKIKHYSVLIPFVSPYGTDEELHLLYTKRTAFLRSHPREICFPGGKVEENESIESAALRETKEELAIPEESVSIIATLQSVPNRQGNGLITPVLGLVNSLQDLKANAEEVERIITVPVSELLEPNTSGYTQFRLSRSGGYSLPVFRTHSQDRIWGMTAIFTHQALSQVFGSKDYPHRIRFLNPIL